MNVKTILQCFRTLVAALCAMLLAPGPPNVYAGAEAQDNSAQAQQPPKIPNDQLDSLVAPIALYPDPLLAQVLAASTYPLEVIQLQQWLQQHPGLKDQALVDAVQKQDWDPSIQGLAPLPDVVKRLADDIKWTTDLGNAFLAQQADVMAAVQRMRAKAQGQGNLKSSDQVKVETQVVESKQVIVIQQANPQVIYVPSYNPVVVYGPPIYPYPAIYYPPPGYYAAGVAIAFGVGVAMGAYWHGGWGYGCGWGHNNVNININNNYVSHYNKTNINNINRSSINSNNWQHNPQHRGGAPYSNKATAARYGGTTRGSSPATRQASARQYQGQSAARQQPSTANRGAGGATASNRSAGTAAGGSAANRPNSGGGERVGNRQVQSASSGRNTGAFAGAANGTSGGAARASSQRGASSLGTSRRARAGRGR